MLYHKRCVIATAGNRMRSNLWSFPVSLPQALLDSLLSTKRRSSCNGGGAAHAGRETWLFAGLYFTLFSYRIFCRWWQSMYVVRAPWGIACCLKEWQSSYSGWLKKRRICRESSTCWTEAAKIEENSCANMCTLNLRPDTKAKICPTWRQWKEAWKVRGGGRKCERSGFHPWWSAVTELLSTFRQKQHPPLAALRFILLIHPMGLLLY